MKPMSAFNNSQNNLLVIAGPCQIETHEHALRMATSLARVVENLPVDFVFKASFDKANRTSWRSPRGVGLAHSLATFEAVRNDVGCRVTTDVHTVSDIWKIAPRVDVVQIPALLSRQTDLLVAAGQCADIVNVKKGQFSAPMTMLHAVDKARSRDKVGGQVWITERGTFFGYGDNVVDFRSLVELRKCDADKIIFDASHSCQRPPIIGGSSLGNREFIEPLARAALAVGIDGLFVEVHDDPANAQSDGDIALPLDEFDGFLKRMLEVWHGCGYRYSSARGFDAAAE